MTRTGFEADEEDVEAGWEVHGGSGSFGASCAQADSRTPRTRQVEVTPAVYSASVPWIVAEIGRYDLHVAAWVLLTFEAAELLAMRSLIGDAFVLHMSEMYAERPQTVLVQRPGV